MSETPVETINRLRVQLESLNNLASRQAIQIGDLTADNRLMRSRGLALAEAALRVCREYDGTHRLMLAVAEWSKTVAGEGGRAVRHGVVAPNNPFDLSGFSPATAAPGATGPGSGTPEVLRPEPHPAEAPASRVDTFDLSMGADYGSLPVSDPRPMTKDERQQRGLNND